MNSRFPGLVFFGFLFTAAVSAPAQNPGRNPAPPPPPLSGPNSYYSGQNAQNSQQVRGNAHSMPKPLGSPSGSAHSSYQLGPAGRWWDEKSTMQAVGLRREQQQKMDELFNANKTAILESYKTFQTRQALLNKLNKDPKADQTTIFAAIDAVNQARASLQKATTQVMLQIRQVMDAGQIDKLEKLY